MGRFMVNVDECSLHVGKDFDCILKLLADIMCLPQRGARIHNDVDLNEVVRAALKLRKSMRKRLFDFKWGRQPTW